MVSTVLPVYSLVLFSVFCISNGDDGYLPSYIHPCDMKDEKFATCVKDQIEAALPLFTKGIPELHVPSLDPVKLDDINIDGSGLKLTFTEAEMHGISNAHLTNLKVSFGSNDEAFSLSFKSNLSLTAHYVIDGRILVLPIQGNGAAVVKAQNIEVQIDSKLTHMKDVNGIHFKLTTPTYKYDIETTTFKMDNLFNGNKQLADVTLQFVNENWRQIMNDVAPPAIKQIVKTCVRAINKFFANVTIKQIVKGYDESRL